VIPKDKPAVVEAVLGSTGAADAILTSAPDQLPGTGVLASTLMDQARAQIWASLATLADDAVFVDLDSLCPDISGLSTVDPFVSLQLPDLFPECPIFQPFHASPELAESIVIPKGDTKSEKKDKRAKEQLTRQDETTRLKVVNASIFMHYKPILVSALQPAKHWRHDRWVNLDDDIAVSAGDALPTMDPPPNGRQLFSLYLIANAYSCIIFRSFWSSAATYAWSLAL
jgi:hypothetical protein